MLADPGASNQRDRCHAGWQPISLIATVGWQQKSEGPV
jgi:hypothetical protein